jgi:hypothetical protein
MEQDEKREVISEFLSEATDKDTDSLITALLQQSQQLQTDKEKEAEEKKNKLVEEAKGEQKIRSVCR